MAATEEPSDPAGDGGGTGADPMEAATEATRSLRGLSPELTARLPQLLEAMRTVGAGFDLHVTLDRIAQTAAELADARYAAIGIIDDAGEGLSDFVTYGVSPQERERIAALPDGRTGLLGALIHDPKPLRLADLGQDVRSAGLPSGHPPMRTFLGVPIRVQGEIFGNLYLTEKRGGGEFSEEDLHMVRVLATEAGIAIGNARVYALTRQRERWIDGSVAVTTELLAGSDVDDALAVVAEQARKLADSAAGIVLLPDDEGRPGDRRRLGGRSRRDPGDADSARKPGDRATPRRGAGVRGRFGHRPTHDHGDRAALRPQHDAAAQKRRPGARHARHARATGAPAPSPVPNGPWPPSSRPRRRWHWCSPTPSATGSGWPSTRTATGSPGTCTTSSSSGCSRRA